MAKSGWVESVEVSDRCWPVLIHQILALALAEDGIPVETAWAHLSGVPDFGGIPRQEFDRLITWMLQDKSLARASGRLILGPKAEKRFGRRNFMELYAVFSSPQSYAVQTQAGQPLGTLNQSFVDQLVDQISCFLLAGRAWVVVQVLHDERRITVDPAPRGRQPTWGGYLPQFLGQAVCQKILEVVTSTEVYGYLTPEAAAILDEQRTKVQGVLSPGHGGIEVSDQEIQWWTFAGGRINSTLRYALAAAEPGWSIIPDNYAVTLRGDTLAMDRFLAAREQLSRPDFWDNAQFWRGVAASLPNYRLSKFQPLMPSWVEQEVLAAYLLDVPATRRWLSATNEQREENRYAPTTIPVKDQATNPHAP